MRKPRILVVIEHYLPGYRAGGSVRSLANLVHWLGDEFEFDIVTRDRDWRASEQYPGVSSLQFIPVGQARVMYVAPDEWRPSLLIEVVRDRDYELLYLSSVFSLVASIMPLALRRCGWFSGKPVILGPRGELSRGAIGIRPHRKHAYLHLGKALGFFQNLIWQASDRLEAEDIAREMGNVPIIEAVDCSPDYTAWSLDGPIREKVPGNARVCFVARISEKKNLEYALRIVGRVKGALTFDIFGPIDNRAYWSYCKHVIASVPPNVNINYHGSVAYETLPSLLRTYDLFVFPTLGENYGHSIVEALAAGCPVLISDRTPWTNLEAEGVGWSIPLSNEEAFVNAIEDVIAMDTFRRDEIARRSHRFALRCAHPRRAIDENRSMFRRALNQSRGVV